MFSLFEVASDVELLPKCSMTYEQAVQCAKRAAIFGDRTLQFPAQLNETKPFCEYVLIRLRMVFNDHLQNL